MDKITMKESHAYKLAQIAVLRTDAICTTDKLEVLRLLMDKEDVAKFVEKIEEEESK